MMMRAAACIFALVGGLLVFACASTTDDVVIAKRPDESGFGTREAGAPPAQDASVSSGMCPTNECPRGRSTCPDSPYPCGVELTSDDENCGACGNACPVIDGLRVRTTCVGGVCRFGCSNNYADCNGLTDDGCEALLLWDKDNCGGCGIKCSDVCTEGKCGCPNGQTFCSYCTNLKTDWENCGQCGNVCPPEPDTLPPLSSKWHARYSACNGGACNYQPACIGMWADCNDDLRVATGNGCETDTGSDPLNCGGCGVACAPGEACVYGKCECQCGSSCFHVTTDIDNCGACRSVCPGSRDDAAHGGPVCNDGVCDYRCDVDWADCDGLSRNGCETNLRSDPVNCGGCGIRCMGTEGQACVDGRCTMKECGIQ